MISGISDPKSLYEHPGPGHREHQNTQHDSLMETAVTDADRDADHDADHKAIERLLSDFAWHADRGEGAALADLFLPDAVLTVGGVDLQGRVAIAADCHRRHENPLRKTRHVWSNLRVLHRDDGAVATAAVQLTYEQTGPDLPTQLRVNDLFDTFRRDAAGRWRFARRLIKRELALCLPVPA